MPTYIFACDLDGFFERDYSMGQAPQSISCPVCGDEANRHYSIFGIEFKGNGWGSKP